MKITDRRFGTYTVLASFAGDESAAGASNSFEVTAAPRAAPSLPEQAMLITPYPTFWITLPFVLFFGAMWAVFAYVAFLAWRVRRLGIVRVTAGRSCMLNCLLMKRLLLSALALSMTGLGPVPLSACALFSSKGAECSTSKTESRCNEMDMGDTQTKVLAAPDASCCDLSRAPVPESQQNAFKSSPIVVPHVVHDDASIASAIHGERQRLTEHDISPPLQQSFLCTFLI